MNEKKKLLSRGSSDGGIEFVETTTTDTERTGVEPSLEPVTDDEEVGANRKLLEASCSTDKVNEERQLKKEFTLFDTVNVVVGQLIGSGIFITPTIVLRYTGSFGLTLIYWAVGGLIAIGGGLTYAELGTLLKNSGGEYSMLREGYSFRKKHPAERLMGDLLGFLGAWYMAFLLKPGTAAVTALTIGKYLAQAITGGAEPAMITTKVGAISFMRKV